MADDYQYDVFLSYRRDELYSEWIPEFLRFFRHWLKQELDGRDPTVFWDQREIKASQDWKKTLGDAIAGSRCMVGLWAPDYFRSGMCRWEWQSFQSRAPELVIPIRWHDGDSFPPEARAIQYEDFSEFTFIGPGFKGTDRYVHFQQKVKDFAKRVAQVVQGAPRFHADWPLADPEGDLPPPHVPLATWG